MRKGQITVFLSLILTIICALIGATIESIQVGVMRMQTECAMDMGMNSIFAEYNRELLDSYDLFFIDSAYGSGHPSVYNTGEHLRRYMEYNMNTSKGLLVFRKGDYLGLKPESAAVSIYSLASDEGGKVFKRQAIHSAKDNLGISAITGVMKQISVYEKSGIKNMDVTKERQRAEDDFHNYEIPPVVHEDGTKEEITIDNPADEVNATREGVLGLVIKDTGQISGKSFLLSELASHRKLAAGEGLIANKEDLDSASNEILFGEYILDKFGTYTNKKDHEAISYEAEYVLIGKSSDLENLKGVVNRLLLLRETANVIYLLGDGPKLAEAEALAATIAGFLGLPAIIDLLKYTLIFAWAFAESTIDVRTLLEGGKVPIMKTSADWTLAIENLLIYQTQTESGRSSDKGIDYNTYIRIFLYFQNKKEKVMRCIDVIEMNLRKTDGNEKFLMDGCLEYIEAEVRVISKKGYEYKIRRNFGYEAVPE